MTIALAQAVNGATGSDVSSVSQAFGGAVTTGSLVVVECARGGASSGAFEAGDCTKSSGTATLGTISLDCTPRHDDIGGGEYIDVAIWSAIVSSGGTCTMQVAHDAGGYMVLGIAEFETDAAWDGSRVADTDGATGSDGYPTVPDITSTGASVFVGGMADLTSLDEGIIPQDSYLTIYEEEDGASTLTGSHIYKIFSGATTDGPVWQLAASRIWYVTGVAYQESEGGDSTAPTLSSPTGTKTGSTTGSGSVDTDEGNGTLYWVVTTSSTGPSVAQVQAGQDHTGSAAADSGSQAVSGTGTQNVSGGFTGLTAETTYYAHYQQQDAATNDSTVATSASFTTDAAGGAVPALVASSIQRQMRNN